jgi:hypothetical protein
MRSGMQEIRRVTFRDPTAVRRCRVGFASPKKPAMPLHLYEQLAGHVHEGAQVALGFIAQRCISSEVTAPHRS